MQNNNNNAVPSGGKIAEKAVCRSNALLQTVFLAILPTGLVSLSRGHNISHISINVSIYGKNIFRVKPVWYKKYNCSLQRNSF